MRTRRKHRVAVATSGDPLGGIQLIWNTGANENHQLNPDGRVAPAQPSIGKKALCLGLHGL